MIRRSQRMLTYRRFSFSPDHTRVPWHSHPLISALAHSTLATRCDDELPRSRSETFSARFSRRSRPERIFYSVFLHLHHRRCSGESRSLHLWTFFLCGLSHPELTITRPGKQQDKLGKWAQTNDKSITGILTDFNLNLHRPSTSNLTTLNQVNIKKKQLCTPLDGCSSV